MVAMAIFNASDDSLSMKWNPGFIPRVFKYVVNFVKACIISLSLLVFIAVVIMTLQSYTYIAYMYLFYLLGVIGKRPHKLE